MRWSYDNNNWHWTKLDSSLDLNDWGNTRAMVASIGTGPSWIVVQTLMTGGILELW